MAVANISNSGLSGQKAKALTATVGGVSNAIFSNTPTGTYSSGGKNYSYVSFLSNGTLTITQAGFADLLIIGGGGGSGSAGSGGGGGAGGHLYIEKAYLPLGSLSVVIGQGGARGYNAGYYDGQQGFNGSPSMLGTLYVSPGGGGGGSRGYDASGDFTYSQYGQNGASGGGNGGSYNSGGPGTPGNGIPGLGNNGGQSSGGGGGGGAGSAGSGSSGGSGISNSITGTAVTRCVGGTVGGGNGTANTGNGGGSGSGGSGIVIVRVQV